MIRFLLIAVTFICFANISRPQPEVERQDFFVGGDAGVRLFVREVVIRTGTGDTGEPILLLHGARVPGLASFDPTVPGGSLAADLAQFEFDVYVMDVRGYGRSTRPKEVDDPPSSHEPLVRSSEAARDISTVVDAILKRRGVARVALFGWATGGQWAGYYASLDPEKVSALILLNSLYRSNSRQPLIGRGIPHE